MGIAFDTIQSADEEPRHLLVIDMYMVAGASAAVGFYIGDKIGSWLTDFIKDKDEMTKLLVKSVGKAGLSTVLFSVAKILSKPPIGIEWLILNGAAIGLIVSIVGDIVRFGTPAFGNIAVKKQKNMESIVST